MVVGAGIAGLAAGVELARQGFSVQLLEASSRVGGRLKTDVSLGVPLDLGASWIHGESGNPITALADRIGAKRVATSYASTATFEFGGAPMSPSREARLDALRDGLYKVVERARNAPQDSTLGPQVWQRLKGDWLSSDDQQLLRFLLHSEFETEYGGFAQANTASRVGHLSSYWHDASDEFNGDDMVFADGYEVISRYFAAQLQGMIRLNEPVKSIDYSGMQVHVTTVKGDYMVDQVVLAVPLGVLKAGHIQIKPALPEAKTRAIEALQMGLLNKLYLKFATPFWEDKADEDWIECLQPTTQQQPSWVQWVNMKRPLGQNILLGFTAADAALVLETLPIEKVVEQAMERLRAVFGRGVPQPVGVLQTKWMQDPYTLGAYSFNAFGMNKNTRVHLTQPVAGRLVFAGEHTHPKYFGTVHGAYLSGLRAARMLADLVK